MFNYNFPEHTGANDMLTQCLKIKEEAQEVEDEVIAYKLPSMFSKDRYALPMELMDCIHACETLLRMLDLSDKELNAIQRSVISKNRSRDYYTK